MAISKSSLQAQKHGLFRPIGMTPLTSLRLMVVVGVGLQALQVLVVGAVAVAHTNG
jgi:hypothetical protein